MSSPSSTVEESKRRLRWPSFSAQIVIGLVAGVLLGWLALSMGTVPNGTADGDPNWLTTTLSTIGSSFVTLLKAIVPPLVFTAVVASIANLRGLANGARLAAKTLIWFAITALIAVSIGIVLGVVLKPGANTGVTIADASDPSHTGSWLDFLNGIIPANFLGTGVGVKTVTDADGVITSASGYLSPNALQIIVIALVIGIAALKVGKKADPFLAFNASLLAVVQKVLWWIIRLAPLGTVGLIGFAIADYGWTSLTSLARFGPLCEPEPLGPVQGCVGRRGARDGKADRCPGKCQRDPAARGHRAGALREIVHRSSPVLLRRRGLRQPPAGVNEYPTETVGNKPWRTPAGRAADPPTAGLRNRAPVPRALHESGSPARGRARARSRTG